MSDLKSSDTNFCSYHADRSTDWRGLCEELLCELENCIAVHYGEGGTHHISAADAVIARADAALSQPEPE